MSEKVYLDKYGAPGLWHNGDFIRYKSQEQADSGSVAEPAQKVRYTDRHGGTGYIGKDGQFKLYGSQKEADEAHPVPAKEARPNYGDEPRYRDQFGATAVVIDGQLIFYKSQDEADGKTPVKPPQKAPEGGLFEPEGDDKPKPKGSKK